MNPSKSRWGDRTRMNFSALEAPHNPSPFDTQNREGHLNLLTASASFSILLTGYSQKHFSLKRFLYRLLLDGR
jgi:hypothetical protein